MVKRQCGYDGCKTLTEVDSSLDFPMLGGVAVKWCDYHSKLYNKRCDVFESLCNEWTGKQLKNKFGRIIKFTHHSDLSNYLYQYNRKEYNRIVKEVRN